MPVIVLPVKLHDACNFCVVCQKMFEPFLVNVNYFSNIVTENVLEGMHNVNIKDDIWNFQSFVNLPELEKPNFAPKRPIELKISDLKL